MSVSRYRSDPLVRGSRLRGSSAAFKRIRLALLNGRINYNTHVVKDSQRLDKIAGQIFGDGRLWWVIAACSGIGWGMQVPPGTMIRVPKDLGQIMGLI